MQINVQRRPQRAFIKILDTAGTREKSLLALNSTLSLVTKPPTFLACQLTSQQQQPIVWLLFLKPGTCVCNVIRPKCLKCKREALECVSMKAGE